MTKTVFMVAALLSINTFAADYCVNLSGTYTLKAGDCKASSDSAEGGKKYQDLVGGPESVQVYQNSVIRIEQNDCDSFKLTRVNGQLQNDQKYHDVSYTYSADGAANFLSADENSIEYRSLFVRGFLNKDEKMKVTKTTKGISIDYVGKIITLAFVVPLPYVERSSCELTKIP